LLGPAVRASPFVVDTWCAYVCVCVGGGEGEGGSEVVIQSLL
jgi:hypothetical protein